MMDGPYHKMVQESWKTEYVRPDLHAESRASCPSARLDGAYWVQQNLNSSQDKVKDDCPWCFLCDLLWMVLVQYSGSMFGIGIKSCGNRLLIS